MLLGGIVLYALQSVYADDSAKALEQVVFFYVPFALLFALLRGLQWTPRELAWGGGALVCWRWSSPAIGFWEFQTRHLLLNPKVIASNQVEEYFRVNSLFFDPNIYGRFLALVMLGLASVLLWAQAAAHLALDDRRAGRPLGRPAHDALAVELRGAAARPRRAGLAALRRQVRGRPGARPRSSSAAVIVFAFAQRLRIDLGDSESLDNATSGRFDLMRGRHRPRAREAAAGLGLGQLQRRVPPPRAQLGARGDVGLAHDPDHGRRRAGHHRARRLRGAAGAGLRAAAARRPRLAGAGGDRRRLRRARAAHVALRRVPRGPGDLDAARARHRAGRARGRAAREAGEDAAAALNGHRREPVVVARTAP